MLRINPISHLITSILLFAALCTVTFGKIIYVDDDAAGANDGTSWENAYNNLQDAIQRAENADEIRMAEGSYKPQILTAPRQKYSAFYLPCLGLTIKGGYAGSSGADSNARDTDAYKTILSGDLNGNDVDVNDPCDLLSHPSRVDNIYHVLRINSVPWLTFDTPDILDGITITGGNAKENVWERNGGGLFVDTGEVCPKLVDCTFLNNSAEARGGAIYIHDYKDVRFDECRFIKNSSGQKGQRQNDGGAVYIYLQDTLTITNCTFLDNFTFGDGGAVATESATNITFINSEFIGNQAYGLGGALAHILTRDEIKIMESKFTNNKAGIMGGAIYFEACSGNLNNCCFIRNSAEIGGAVDTIFTGLEFNNCTFLNNLASEGGALRNSGGFPTLENCIFSGNKAVNGGAIANVNSATIFVTNCTIVGNRASDGSGCLDNMYRSNTTFENCIFWGEDNGILNRDGSEITINYSDVQGGWEGEGNFDADPLFADPGHWANVNDPNIAVEPNDPNSVWINGDYHLQSQVGRWDPVSESWVMDDVTSLCIDVGDPNSPVGDEPEPNGGRINMGAYGGTVEASMSPGGAEQLVYIQWLGHASVKVWTDDCIVYVDPQRLNITPHDATLVCVTHAHGDHYSPSDIARVSNTQTQFTAPPDVVTQYGSGQTIAPGQTIEFDFVTIKAVPAYNINKTNHPKSNNWVGYIIELGGKRIYVAGDTDLIEEMKSLGDIDVAFLPAGGTYTMNATEAAQATEYIKPDLAIPYHWGQVVGTLADAQRFVELARCPAMVMAAGETISSDNWPEYSPLIAHWAFDETEGDIAHDSAGDNNGTLYGEPAWQPAGGMIDGALLLEGIGDYVSADCVLDPADWPFSVFAWIKGGAAGQVVISQADGTGSGATWLGADGSLGRLMTGLVPPPAGRFVPQPLVCEFVIADGQWHHIGFVWDGSYRVLYVDGVEVAKDAAAQNPLKSADGSLHIGAGKVPEAGTFFSGMVDDVRIYNLALTADEIDALVH